MTSKTVTDIGKTLDAQRERQDADKAAIMYRKAKSNALVQRDRAADIMLRYEGDVITDTADYNAYRNHLDAAIADERRAKMLKRSVKASKRNAARLSVREPRTYSPFKPDSFFMDLATVAGGTQYVSPTAHDAYAGAQKRLAQHGRELAAELRNNRSGKEGQYILRAVRNNYRTDHEGPSMTRANVYEQEQRAASSSSTSLGSFVAPYYVVSEQAVYRAPVSSFIDQAHNAPLPPYGLTVDLPQWLSGSTVAQQVADNAGVSVSAPTAAFESVALNTFAGGIVIAQQLLDRGGDPDTGTGFDTLAYAQLKQNYDAAVDTAVITNAIAAGGTVSEATTLTVDLFLQNLADGRNNMSAAGVHLRPTHIYAQQQFLDGWLTAQYDTTGHPIFPPSDTVGAEPNPGSPVLLSAWSGYNIGTTAIYVDENIPAQTGHATYAQVLLVDAQEVFVWRDPTPTFRTIISGTQAASLSVTVQAYGYAGSVARYAAAVQTLSGAGYANLVD